MRIVLYIVWKEYLQVVRDRATLFQVLAIPMVQLVLLSFAATFEVTRTPVHLVDLDRSSASRGLVDRLEATGYFEVVGRSGSVEEGDRSLVAGDATMVLRVPAGFERDLSREGEAPVEVVLNSEQGAAAGIVRSYAARVIERYAAELREARPSGGAGTRVGAGGGAAEPGVAAPGSRIRGDDGGGTALDSGVRGDDGGGAALDSGVRGNGGGGVNERPIEVRTRGWYNPSLEYLDYMVPGILVALVTIIGTLLTAQNIAREKELGTLEQLNVTPLTRGQFIAGKLLPFWLLGMGELAVGLVLARLVFDIPFRGSLVVVFGLGAIYLVAALGLGLLISTMADTQQQAMFVTFFVMMVYLLMSGLYTPTTSMPEWVQWLAEANPGKHFVYVMRAVLVKGAGLADLQREAVALTLFGAGVLGLAVARYSKRAG